MKKLTAKKNLLTYSFLFVVIFFLKMPVLADQEPITSTEELKTLLKRDFLINFNEGDVVLMSQVNNIPESVILKGYGKLGPQSEKLAKDAALADMKRNYINFIKGSTFEINNNSLLINNSFIISSPKNKIEEKTLPELNIYQVEMDVEIPDYVRKYSSNLPSVISIGTAEIKDKKNILDSYNNARNSAIINGLTAYYGNLNKKQKGVIFFQKILYNSLETLINSDTFFYVVQFGIAEPKNIPEKKPEEKKKPKSNKNLSKFLNKEE